MPQGRVKRYERNSGFGFIETGQGDLFVHHTALKNREFLLPGQQVEFQVEPGERGPRAVDVRVIEDVLPQRKNHPDWRGHRGGAPRFEGQEERVQPGRVGGRRSRRAGDTARARPTSVPPTEHLGPPVDEREDEAEGTGSARVQSASEREGEP